MNDFHDALPVLSHEAIEVARAFTIGELEPRLVEGEASPIHFLPVGEGRTAALAPYLLVDVGMPNRYVRVALEAGDADAPRLGAAELWRAGEGAGAAPGAIADDYVPLFEELNALLLA